MADIPQIFGQELPPANIDANLMTVAFGDQAMVNIFVANQTTNFDYFTINVLPYDQSTQPANYIAFQSPIIGGGIVNFAQIYLNSGDRIIVSSINGFTSFTATGVLYTPVVSGGGGGGGATGPTGPTGAMGIQGIQGIQGIGSTGPQGVAGTTGIQGPQGIAGSLGPTGPQGITGAQGAQGASVTLRGTVATVGNLPTGAAAGDAWIVSCGPTAGHLYFWDVTFSTWDDVGTIQGPQGIQGIQGPQGVAGSAGPTGPQGHQGPTGIQGQQGIQGCLGPTGPAGCAAYISWAAIACKNTVCGPSKIALGVLAGTNQSSCAIAIGTEAASNCQAARAIAIGSYAGQLNQSVNSIAIGGGAGYCNQLDNAVAVGACAGGYNQGQSSIAVGSGAGGCNQSHYSIAVGTGSGTTQQSPGSIAIGTVSGSCYQGAFSTAVGVNAGSYNQGYCSVAIGTTAGLCNQGNSAVAIGSGSGATNQGNLTVAIGLLAANCKQGDNAIAIGARAGLNAQGSCSVAIGNNAGYSCQPVNSIILNASGNAVNGTSSGFFVNPIRNELCYTCSPVYYNASTSEVTFGPSPHFIAGTGYNSPNMVLPQKCDSNWAFGGASNCVCSFYIQAKFFGNSISTRGFRVLDSSSCGVPFSVDGTATTSVSGSMVVQSTDSSANFTVRFKGATGGDQFGFITCGTPGNGVEFQSLNSCGSCYSQFNLTGTNVTVQSWTGSGFNNWTFATSGEIVFPDSSAQTTAYLGAGAGVNQQLGTGDSVIFAEGNINVFAVGSTLTIGTQIFYTHPQGFSVNENFDITNQGVQENFTGYHFASGIGIDGVAFTLARSGYFTDGFGITGDAFNNNFVIGSETYNTDFQFKNGIGMPFDVSGGNTLATITRTGNLVLTSNSALQFGTSAVQEVNSNELDLYSGGNVYITSASSEWNFQSTGTIVFPDGSLQNTAYTKLKSGFDSQYPVLVLNNVNVAIDNTGNPTIGAVNTNFNATYTVDYTYYDGSNYQRAVNGGNSTILTSSSTGLGYTFGYSGDTLIANIVDNTDAAIYRVTYIAGASGPTDGYGTIILEQMV